MHAPQRPQLNLRFITLSVSLAACNPSLSASTLDTYIGANNGLWSNPANWSLGIVPNNSPSTTYAVLPQPRRRIMHPPGHPRHHRHPPHLARHHPLHPELPIPHPRR